MSVVGNQENIDHELLSWARKNLRYTVDNDNYARMISGLSYDYEDPKLVNARLITSEMTTKLRNLRLEDFPGPVEYHTRRQNDVRKILGKYGEEVFAEPFLAEYGFNISVGYNFYSNVDALYLDSSLILIGDDVVLAPGVTLSTHRHPAEGKLDGKDAEEKTSPRALPIKIGDRVWIGANATVIGGVTIGDRAVIAASAVVTEDVPPDVIYGGRPGRVLRHIDN